MAQLRAGRAFSARVRSAVRRSSEAMGRCPASDSAGAKPTSTRRVPLPMGISVPAGAVVHGHGDAQGAGSGAVLPVPVGDAQGGGDHELVVDGVAEPLGRCGTGSSVTSMPLPGEGSGVPCATRAGRRPPVAGCPGPVVRVPRGGVGGAAGYGVAAAVQLRGGGQTPQTGRAVEGGVVDGEEQYAAGTSGSSPPPAVSAATTVQGRASASARVPASGERTGPAGGKVTTSVSGSPVSSHS